MLTHYIISLRCDEPNRASYLWGYQLYGALMELVDPKFGDCVHEDGATPLRQYLQVDRSRLYWHISLFGEEAKEALSPILESKTQYTLQKHQVVLNVVEIEQMEITEEPWLFSQGHSVHHLRFDTPTCFKSQKQYQPLPTPRLLLQNLIISWNCAFLDCPICDEDGEGLDALAQGIHFADFSLRHGTFYLKGHRIPGFTGFLAIENHLEGFQKQLVDGLLAFSTYAGVGIKTTLGMGGTRHSLL